LEAALGLLNRKQVEVRWKAFELNPDMPREGMNRAEYRERKFGSDMAGQLEERVTEAARHEGLELRYDRIARVPNTFAAHRLIWLAGRDGVQDAVVESLFRGYFIEGVDVGDPAVLLRIGADAGLPAPLVVDLLAGGAGADEVRAEEAAARDAGVTGVPTFFVDGAAVTSGAHPAELLASMLGPALGVARCDLGGGTC